MPDNITVYLTDDHANGGLYKYMMDQPGDLNSGTLYAAKLQQKSTTVQGTGGTFMVRGGCWAGMGGLGWACWEGTAAASGPGGCGSLVRGSLTCPRSMAAWLLTRAAPPALPCS
jgi:hypothetical protein